MGLTRSGDGGQPAAKAHAGPGVAVHPSTTLRYPGWVGRGLASSSFSPSLVLPWPKRHEATDFGSRTSRSPTRSKPWRAGSHVEDQWLEARSACAAARKMRHNADLSFASVRRPSFYVTQPINRRRYSRCVPLALVNPPASVSTRSAVPRWGRTSSGSPSQRSSRTAAAPCWTMSPAGSWAIRSRLSLTESLSPLEPLSSPACEILRERLAQGPVYEASRREAALWWVAEMRENAPEAARLEHQAANAGRGALAGPPLGRIVFRRA